MSNKNEKRKYEKVIKNNHFTNDIEVSKMSDIYSEVEMEEFESKFKHHKYDFSKNNFYHTNELYENGMDYSNWFKLHYTISNQVGELSPEPFKLLLTLVCHPHTKSKEVLHISLKDLMFRVNISDTRTIKKYINRLIQQKYIYISNYNKDMKVNDILDILIFYNNNPIAFVSKGFKPIPIDYFNRCLLTLEPIKCALVCILIDNFTYFQNTQFTDKETGEYIYTYRQCEYAFPSLEQLGKILGCERHTIKTHIEELSKSKIISYERFGKESTFENEKGEATKVINPNYIYRVRLLQRLEYQYYYNFNYTKYDKRSNKTITNIRSNLTNYLKSDKQDLVEQHDWASVKYMYKDIDKAIKNKNMEYYNNKPNLLAIDNLSNEDIIPKPKKQIHIPQNEEINEYEQEEHYSQIITKNNIEYMLRGKNF